MGEIKTLGVPFDRKFRNDLNTNFTETKTRIDNIIVNNPRPSEVVDARGGEPVLKDRLDGVDTQLKNITT